MTASAPLLLIVDDSRTSRTLIRAMLGQLRPDWRTMEAASGEEALAMLDQSPPDFITLDINMTGMSGLETAGRIRIKFPDIRIVICSANIQESVRQAAEKAGVHFVPKPISMKTVTEAVAHFEA